MDADGHSAGEQSAIRDDAKGGCWQTCRFWNQRKETMAETEVNNVKSTSSSPFTLDSGLFFESVAALFKINGMQSDLGGTATTIPN